MRRIAGRMNSACEPGVPAAWVSSSAKCATRWPVVRSSRTVGLSAASGGSKFSRGAPVGTAAPCGNATRIGADGEKPSARFHIVGSTCLPSKLTGSAPAGSARRRPVVAEASAPLIGPRITLGFEGSLVDVPDRPGYAFAGALVPELVLGSYIYDDRADVAADIDDRRPIRIRDARCADA